MWPFKKRQSPAEAALEIMPHAISFAATRWQSFCETLPLKDSVTLDDRITLFFVPFSQASDL